VAIDVLKPYETTSRETDEIIELIRIAGRKAMKERDGG
jgi:hypothetical protein